MKYYEFESSSGRELHHKHQFKYFIIKQYIHKGETVCYPIVNIAFKDKSACCDYIKSYGDKLNYHYDYKIVSGVLDGFTVVVH